MHLWRDLNDIFPKPPFFFVVRDSLAFEEIVAEIHLRLCVILNVTLVEVSLCSGVPGVSSLVVFVMAA